MRSPLLLLFVAAGALGALAPASAAPRADPIHGPDTLAQVKVADRLVVLAADPRVSLTMHPPVAIIAGDGRQPFLFCSSQGTLFCQSQLNLAPFYTKKKEVYHGRIASAISRDFGQTWQPWTYQANHDDVNIEGGMVECADGTILLLDTYIMPGARPEHGVGEVWKSHDDLHTFVGPSDADFYLPKIEWGGSTGDNGSPHTSARLHRSVIEMPNHDLLTLVYSRFKGDTAPSAYMPTMMKSRVVVLRSSDQGAHWAYLATVGVDSGVGTEGFGEPVLVRLSQGSHAGRLLCLMRTGRDLYGSHSDDGGATWAVPAPVAFPGIDIYDTKQWEHLYADAQAPGYVPISEMIGAAVDPDLIEMHDGTLVCAVGVRTPARLFLKNWRAKANGDYLAFSFDGGDTWTHVVEFRSGAPTTQYMGLREIKPGLLYVVYDNSIWNMPGETMGFQLEVQRADLAGRARTVLLGGLASGSQGTARLHAAEALALHGAADQVRPVFTAALPAGDSTPFVRIGLWRVLARCAATPAERESWVAKIRAQLDPPGTDWINVTESLAKLGDVLSGPPLEAVRRLVATHPEPEVIFGLWTEVLAGDRSQTARIGRALARPEFVARLRAAYVLGWLQVTDPAILAELAEAADKEPATTEAYPYMIGAAFDLNASPARAAAWREKLRRILEHGAPLARAEACRCLVRRDGAADLGRFIALLDSPEIETRIGAATAILTLSGPGR